MVALVALWPMWINEDCSQVVSRINFSKKNWRKASEKKAECVYCNKCNSLTLYCVCVDKIQEMPNTNVQLLIIQTRRESTSTFSQPTQHSL